MAFPDRSRCHLNSRFPKSRNPNRKFRFGSCSRHTCRTTVRRMRHIDIPSELHTRDCMPDRFPFPRPTTTVHSAYRSAPSFSSKAFRVPQLSEALANREGGLMPRMLVTQVHMDFELC